MAANDVAEKMLAQESLNDKTVEEEKQRLMIIPKLGKGVVVDSPDEKVDDELEEEEIKSMDDIIKRLGVGPWNLIYFLVTGSSYSLEVINLLGGEFIAPPLPFSCADSANQTSATSSYEGSQCFVTDSVSESDYNMTDNEQCRSFLYDSSTYYSTLTFTEEFDLVCDNQWMRHWFQLSFTLGSLVGCVLSGIFADRFGRQRVVWYSCVSMFILTITHVGASNVATVFCSRFFMGIFNVAALTTSFTIGMECIPMKYRSTFNIAVASPYALMVSFLPLFAFYLRNWRYIEMIAFIPLTVMLLTTNPFIMRESPRYLVERGRYSEAAEAINRARQLNKYSAKSFPENLEQILRNISKEELTPSKNSDTANESLMEHVLLLFTSKSMLRLTLTTIVVEVITGMIYLSIPLSSQGSNSPYLYMAAMGIMELPAYTLSTPIAARVSRKRLVLTTYLLAMVLELSLALATFLHIKNDLVNIIISALAYNVVSFGFMVSLTLFMELYPTSVRSLGTSLCFLMLNVGFNIPPIMDTILPAELPWLPLLIYGSCISFAALLVLFLPETRNRPLLQTVGEYRDYYEGKAMQYITNEDELQQRV